MLILDIINYLYVFVVGIGLIILMITNTKHPKEKVKKIMRGRITLAKC